MTRRERFLAAMRFEPLDRIPWAPKMFHGYYLQGQDAKWRAKNWTELADYLDVEMMLFASGGAHRYSRVEVSAKESDHRRTITYDTPVGALREVMAYSESAREWHPAEPLLKTREDYDTFQFILEDQRFEPDRSAYLEYEKLIGDRGVIFVTGPSTPFMRLLQFEIGIPQIYYHLQDHLDKLETTLQLMADRNCHAYRKIVETTPGDLVLIVENTSTTLTSPGIYLKYCQPVIMRYVDIIRRAGKTPLVHMCGHLKDLLPHIADLKVAAIEAFSSPPVGNTDLIDGRRALGRDTALIGGLNAVLLDQMSVPDLCALVEEQLAPLPEHTGVVLTPGGILPPGCTIDRLKEISEAFRPLLVAG